MEPPVLKDVKDTANTEGEQNGKAVKVEEDDDKQQADDDVYYGDDRDRVMADNGGQDGDEIVIPHKGFQVMIKTIPPDIGRMRLEPVRPF